MKIFGILLTVIIVELLDVQAQGRDQQKPYQPVYNYGSSTQYVSSNNNNGPSKGYSSSSTYGPANFGSSGWSTSVQSNGNNQVTVSNRVNQNGENERYISMTNPKVIIDGDHMNCNGLICPADTFKCVVTSEGLADNPRQMRSVSECIDKLENVLESKEFTELNPYPAVDPIYSRHVVVERNGRVMSEDSEHNSFNAGQPGRELTKEEQEELQRNMEHLQSELQRQQETFQMNMQAFQNNIKKQMENAFGNGFPFGNNYGYPYGNSYGNPNGYPYGNPFGNNFPFAQNYYPVNNFPFNHGYANNFNQYTSYPNAPTNNNAYHYDNNHNSVDHDNN